MWCRTVKRSDEICESSKEVGQNYAITAQSDTAHAQDSWTDIHICENKVVNMKKVQEFGTVNEGDDCTNVVNETELSHDPKLELGETKKRTKRGPGEKKVGRGGRKESERERERTEGGEKSRERTGERERREGEETRGEDRRDGERKGLSPELE
ncbi:hypothetical protein TNCV_4227141 [Trichonephila clavipes]|nr:hypothetical protein TNCV_4227141 [Trichonephila clavipes]